VGQQQSVIEGAKDRPWGARAWQGKKMDTIRTIQTGPPKWDGAMEKAKGPQRRALRKKLPSKWAEGAEDNELTTRLLGGK